MRQPRRGVKICATSWMRYKRPDLRASQLRGLSPFLTPCCPCCRRAGGQTAGRQYRPELLGVRDFEIRMRAWGVVWRAYLRDSDILGRTVRNFTQQEFANYVMRPGRIAFLCGVRWAGPAAGGIFASWVSCTASLQRLVVACWRASSS